MATIRIVDLQNGTIEGVKADYVTSQVRITISVPLDEITPAIREDLAFLGFMKMKCDVAIESKQPEMDFGKTDKTKRS